MEISQIGSLTGRLIKQLLKGAILIALVASMGHVLTTRVTAQAVNEYQVKAAFIFNFAKFVEWPVDASGEPGVLVVGVVGDDPFGGALDRLNGSLVNGRRLRIRHLRSGTTFGPVRFCSSAIPRDETCRKFSIASRGRAS